MKKIVTTISVLFCLIPSLTLAQRNLMGVPTLNNLIVAQLSTSKQVSPLEPVRYTKFKARISKMKVIRNSDGGLEFVGTDVCTVQGEAPVYDVRQKKGFSIPYRTVATCLSELKGTPFTVKLVTYLTYSRGMMVDTTKDAKVFYSFLQSDNGKLYRDWSTSQAASADLDAKSFIGFLQPDLTWECTADGCKPGLDEFHSAIIEIED